MVNVLKRVLTSSAGTRVDSCDKRRLLFELRSTAMTLVICTTG